MGKLWEVALLIIVIAIALKLVATIVVPLLPFIAVTVLIGLAGSYFYRRSRRW